MVKQNQAKMHRGLDTTLRLRWTSLRSDREKDGLGLYASVCFLPPPILSTAAPTDTRWVIHGKEADGPGEGC